MASKNLEINYLAFNIPKNKNNLNILAQNYASLISFEITQSRRLKENGMKVCYKLSVSDDLVKDAESFINGYDSIECNKFSIIEDIIPVAQVTSIYNSFLKSKSDFVLFLDGDTVFLRSFISDLLSRMKETGSDIAMAHECGSTGFNPYPNYNCGFLLMRRNDTTQLLLESWMNLINKNRDIAKHGNQRLFPHALGIANPRIFSIDNVYNLRCHPVFGNISQVWSPVYMVHNQDLSRYWTNQVKSFDSSLVELMSNISIHNLLNNIDQYFTPIDEPHKPRYVGGSFFDINAY